MHEHYILCEQHGIQELVILDIPPEIEGDMILNGISFKKYKDTVIYADSDNDDEDKIILISYTLCKKCLIELEETFNRGINEQRQP